MGERTCHARHRYPRCCTVSNYDRGDPTNDYGRALLRRLRSLPDQPQLARLRKAPHRSGRHERCAVECRFLISICLTE